jgi:adenylate cyclase
MKLKNLPIRLTVTGAFIISMTLAVFFVAYINFTENQREIVRTAHQLVENAVDIAKQNIDGALGRARIVASGVADLPADVLDWKNPASLHAYLLRSLRHDPNIYGTFVGFPDGGFVQAVNFRNPDGTSRGVPGVPAEATNGLRVIEGSADETARREIWWYFGRDGKSLTDAAGTAPAPTAYDPRARGWFKEALTNGRTSFSDVYVFASLKRHGITISVPATNVGGAVIGVDLPLTNLAQLMKRLRPGENGTIAIIDGSDNLIAHHDLEKIFRRTDDGKLQITPLHAVDDPQLRAGVTAMRIARETTDIDGSLGFETDLGDLVASLKPAGDQKLLDWKIISVADTRDFTERLRASLQRSAVFTLVIFALAIVVVTLLAGWIALPVIRLHDMADRISDLNLSSADTPVSPFNEISSLQGSMERMRGALDTFLRYVPRDLVRTLVQSGQAATVGGTKRVVTLMFSDIEGFTTLTERMDTEQVLEKTSLYFERMSFAIQANRGTIDKYIGDAIMAMWNAPADDEFHIDNACRGVLTARQMSEDLNEEFLAAGEPIMRTRFGLHSGEALVGNMGASDRLQYTCLGPMVNLAARIEGLNKIYGTQILVSEPIRRKVSRDYVLRRIDIVTAKGTTIPMTLYELMGERDPDAAFYIGDERMQQASRYEEAFDFYLHRDFELAVDILQKLHDQTPDDGAVAVLLEKCRRYAETPPGPDWNGVTAIDSK